MSEEASSRAECEHALQYAVHDGISLAGDFYKPAGASNVPVVVAVHGGAWKVGDATDFQYWGPWLASRPGVLVLRSWSFISRMRVVLWRDRLWKNCRSYGEGGIRRSLSEFRSRCSGQPRIRTGTQIRICLRGEIKRTYEKKVPRARGSLSTTPVDRRAP